MHDPQSNACKKTSSASLVGIRGIDGSANLEEHTEEEAS